MKSTKLVATLLLLFITSAIFAQKVHYKDRYYTIVKSKIFHRGYDVYGKLSPGKIDTIHIIVKELYTERGKLKEKYKKRKKRDRYKLPETFWEQREIAVAKAVNNAENKTTETTIQASKTENNTLVSEETVLKETPAFAKEKSAAQQEQEPSEKIQKHEVSQTKKTPSSTKDKKVENDKKSDHDNDVKVIMKEEADQNKKEIEEKSARKEEKKAEMKEKIQQQKQEKKEGALDQKEKSAKKQKNKAEKSIAKEKRDDKKSVNKAEQQQSKETKSLEEKKKDLVKEKKTQSKKQKALKAKEAALAAASAVSTSVVNKEGTFGTIYIKINKEKTSTTKNGAVLLFFDIINNSNKDLVILKPNNSIDNRLDFFSNTMECENIPAIATDYLPKELKIKDGDYLTIPANAKIELFINGEHRNWLACNSENVILQIQYNPFKNAEEGSELEPSLKKELNKSLKRITPIKIESENIKFKLNKPE